LVNLVQQAVSKDSGMSQRATVCSAIFLRYLFIVLLKNIL